LNKKVLILGCSLTQGSYGPTEQHYTKEEIVSSYGWYDSLKCLKDLEIDVFAFGGAGYTNFAEVLVDLHINDKLKDYSMLIIQETSEPRFALRKKDFSWYPSNEIKGRDLLIHHRYAFCFPPQVIFSNREATFKQVWDEFYSIKSFPDKLTLDILESVTYKNLVKFSLAYINQTIEQYNLKCFVFSVFDPITNSENLPNATRLDLPSNLYYEIKNDSLKNLSSESELSDSYIRHFSNLGNKKLGEIINESLKKVI
jgi:hypothetical protein